jgi:hypothetical protein
MPWENQDGIGLAGIDDISTLQKFLIGVIHLIAGRDQAN